VEGLLGVIVGDPLLGKRDNDLSLFFFCSIIGVCASFVGDSVFSKTVLVLIADFFRHVST
jgi:hypothetical protein